MRLSDVVKRHSLAAGIIAMAMLVAGTFVEGGSLLQKSLFAIGAPVLGITAYSNRQMMFTIMQVVLTISAVVAFFNLPDIAKYALMIGSSLAGIVYLIRKGHSSEDSWWPLGGAGLLSIAAGFATNAVAYPLIFNSFLAAGGWIVALYSAIGAFHFKVRIALIWLVLNIIFSITPTMTVLSQIL